MKKILIISNSHDLHVDLLLPILASKQHTAFRLDLDSFPRDYQITQQFFKGKMQARLSHIPTNTTIEHGDIGAVWLRKPAEFAYLSDNLTVQEKAFAKLETEQTIFGFIYSLNCYWMSHPNAMRAAMWKTEQLQRAQNMGFIIPDSLVSNSPDHVHSFMASIDGNAIYKTLSSPTLAAEEVAPEHIRNRALPTTLITPELMDCLNSVAELPCHFQAYVKKQYEIRVTVIGKRLFSAKIDSQADERTLIDCRDMSAEIAYQAVTIPDNIQQMCLDFVASYQLNYSALDFIVTPNNEYVFLENNPNGQFLYVQQLIPEFTLLETLADCLIEGALCNNK
jgi:glutathione synthase/RimK-type ligase-like ATP-grasp enzyme